MSMEGSRARRKSLPQFNARYANVAESKEEVCNTLLQELNSSYRVVRLQKEQQYRLNDIANVRSCQRLKRRRRQASGQQGGPTGQGQQYQNTEDDVQGDGHSFHSVDGNFDNFDEETESTSTRGRGRGRGRGRDGIPLRQPQVLGDDDLVRSREETEFTSTRGRGRGRGRDGIPLRQPQVLRDDNAVHSEEETEFTSTRGRGRGRDGIPLRQPQVLGDDNLVHSEDETESTRGRGRRRARGRGRDGIQSQQPGQPLTRARSSPRFQEGVQTEGADGGFGDDDDRDVSLPSREVRQISRIGCSYETLYVAFGLLLSSHV